MNKDINIAELRKAIISCNKAGEEIDLSDLDLSNANLRIANLSFANLRNANLSFTDLTGANLRNADLSFASLRGVTLTGCGVMRIYGHPWEVTIYPTNLAIGCERHTPEEWEGFGDDFINAMDAEAIEWWREWREIILTAARMVQS